MSTSKQPKCENPLQEAELGQGDQGGEIHFILHKCHVLTL